MILFGIAFLTLLILVCIDEYLACKESNRLKKFSKQDYFVTPDNPYRNKRGATYHPTLWEFKKLKKENDDLKKYHCYADGQAYYDEERKIASNEHRLGLMRKRIKEQFGRPEQSGDTHAA